MRVAYFHVTHPNYKESSVAQTQGLISSQDIIDVEHGVISDPITNINLNNSEMNVGVIIEAIVLTDDIDKCI